MKILLPVDESKCSDKTVEWASEFLKPTSTELWILHVLTTLPEVPLSKEDQDYAENMVDTVKTTFEQKGFKNVNTIVLVGSVVEGILKAALDKKIEQVVIGSHGRTGLSKLLMGSVASEVFKACPVPVLVHNNVGSSHASLSVSHPGDKHVSV